MNPDIEMIKGLNSEVKKLEAVVPELAELGVTLTMEKRRRYVLSAREITHSYTLPLWESYNSKGKWRKDQQVELIEYLKHYSQITEGNYFETCLAKIAAKLLLQIQSAGLLETLEVMYEDSIYASIGKAVTVGARDFFDLNWKLDAKRRKKQRYLRDKEVNNFTGIGLPTLRNHRSLNKGLPFIKMGKTILYDKEDIIAYMEKRKVQTNE